MPERELPGMHLRIEKEKGGKCKGLKHLSVSSGEKLFSVVPSTAVYKVHDDLKKAEPVAVRSTREGQAHQQQAHTGSWGLGPRAK